MWVGRTVNCKLLTRDVVVKVGTSTIGRQCPCRRQKMSCYRMLSTETDDTNDLLTNRAETVIIGGGIVGTSIAYHLAKLGQKGVLLLEKSELTAGSTWHAAGLTTFFHPGINVKRLHYYSLHLYDALEKETGQNVGLHKCGSLRLADSPQRVDEFRYQMSRQGWNQALQRLVWPHEIRRLHPLLNMDRIEAGLYNPADGHVDPYSLTQALAIGARQYGAVIKQGTSVTALKQTGSGSWTMETADGHRFEAARVVNAAGLWAREIGQLTGLDWPLVPVHHQYVVTGAVPAVQSLQKELPVIRDLTGSYYMRQERDGLLFGPYEHATKMKLCDDWYHNGVPPGFGKELFESDLDRLQEHMDRAMDMVPVLQDAEIQRVVCGPMTYTPDLLPMVGPVRGLRNYWCAVGFGYGIIHAGGVGRYLAEWILNGEPSYDLVEIDPDRYGHWTDAAYTMAKVRESYGMNNAVGFPREERPAGRPTARRRSAVYDRLRDRGAEFGFHSGWEQPNWFALTGDQPGYVPSFRQTNWFEPVKRECRMVMEKAGMIDLTPYGKLEVRGRDAARLLDRLTANDLPAIGRTVVTHMLTKRGGVYAEMTVTRLEDDCFFCITGALSELHDLRWIEEELWQGNYDAEVLNVTDDWGCLGLAGPWSREILSTLVSDDISDDTFPFLHSRCMSVAGIPTRAIRISSTGELGWELYAPPGGLGNIYDSIMKCGRVGDFGAYALNSLRIEKDFRAWGSDVTVDANPYEAGLEDFVKLDKATEFVGREAVRQIRAQGPRRRSVVLTVDADDTDAVGNESVWYGDQVVGHTTSGAYGATVGRSLAFAYIPTELTEPGTEVHVDLLGDRRRAVVQKGAPVEVEVDRVKERGQKDAVADATLRYDTVYNVPELPT